MRIDILSLFPGYFKGPFDESIMRRAREKGILDINFIDIRDFSEERYNRVDDRPYGGGPGMVLMAEPVVKAIRSVKTPRSRVIYLSPQGKMLTAQYSRKLAENGHLILLCGHYEGVDERALESEIDEEISIGNYVLTNGCIAAIVLVDAVMRFVPGVLGHEGAADEDSFEEGLHGLLDCPHYTRPPVFEGKAVPEILLSGNHEKIALWRKQQALNKTRRMRPDLLKD
jgi:tRNA (guanine37-N1)-methyltransferase